MAERFAIQGINHARGFLGIEGREAHPPFGTGFASQLSMPPAHIVLRSCWSWRNSSTTLGTWIRSCTPSQRCAPHWAPHWSYCSSMCSSSAPADPYDRGAEPRDSPTCAEVYWSGAPDCPEFHRSLCQCAFSSTKLDCARLWNDQLETRMVLVLLPHIPCPPLGSTTLDDGQDADTWVPGTMCPLAALCCFLPPAF